MVDKKKFTRQSGAPVGDNQNKEGLAEALNLPMEEVHSFDLTPYNRWAPKPTNVYYK